MEQEKIKKLEKMKETFKNVTKTMNKPRFEEEACSKNHYWKKIK